MTQYIRLTNSTENQTTTNYCKEWFGEKCSDNKDGRGGNKGNYCHWNNYINCGPLEGCFCDCENEFETIKSDLKEYNSTVVSDVTLSQLNEQFIWGHTKVEYNKKCLIPTGTTMVPNFNNVTTSIIESGTKPLYVKTCQEFTLEIGWPFQKTLNWNDCIPQVPNTPKPHCDNISNCRKSKAVKETNEYNIYEVKDSKGTVIKTDFDIFKTTTKPIRKKKSVDWNRKDACEKQGKKIGGPCGCVTDFVGTYILLKGACKCSCSIEKN